MNMPFSPGGPNFNGTIMGPQSQTYPGGLGGLAYGAQHSDMPVPKPVVPSGTKADTAGIEAAKQKMAGVRERYSSSSLVRDVKRELAPYLKIGSDNILNLASSFAKSAQEPPNKPDDDGMTWTYSGGSANLGGFGTFDNKGQGTGQFKGFSRDPNRPAPTAYQGLTKSQLPAGAPNSPNSTGGFQFDPNGYGSMFGASKAKGLQRTRYNMKSKADQLPEGATPGQTRSGTFSQGQLVTRHPDSAGPSGASHAGPPGTSHPLAGTRPLNERGQDPDNLEQYYMDNPATRPGPTSGRMPTSEMGQTDWQASQRLQQPQQPQQPQQTAASQAKPPNSGPDPAKLEQYYLDNPAARPRVPGVQQPQMPQKPPMPRQSPVQAATRQAKPMDEGQRGGSFWDKTKSFFGGVGSAMGRAGHPGQRPQIPVQPVPSQANSGPDPAKLEQYYLDNPAARPRP